MTKEEQPQGGGGRRKGKGGKDTSSSYRDRAAERREAEAEAAELNAHVCGSGKSILHSSSGAAMVHSLSHRMEGDEDAHLASTSGLDFDLLRRVREKIRLQEEADRLEEEEEEERQRQEEMKEMRSKKAIRVNPAKTGMGRSAQRFLMKASHVTEAWPRVETFLPGRMVYVYGTTEATPSMPAAVRRSRENFAGSMDVNGRGGDAADNERLGLPPALAQTLLKVMTSERAGKMRKMRRKERLAKLAELVRIEEEAMRASIAKADEEARREKKQAEAVEDVDDMFADDDDEEEKNQNVSQKTSDACAGTGNLPPVSATTRGWGSINGAKTARAPGESLFASGGFSDVATAATGGTASDMPGSVAVGGIVVSATETEAEKEAAVRRKKLMEMVQDGYDECYPDYAAGFGTSFMDGDDDDDENGDDKKKKGKVRLKKDGTEMSAAEERAAEAAERKRKKEAKFSSDFHKVNLIIKRKEMERGGGGGGTSDNGPGTNTTREETGTPASKKSRL